jgi:farnesyl diphosphate synthase
LDASGNTVAIGKTAGKDAAAGKATVVSLLGLEYAAKQARTLGEQAASHLDGFGSKAQRLRDLAGYVVSRTY